ncbi:MAG: hypothetical protein J07HN6_00942 [Halonotius sp. J07HN6]|nr:MAG: hypothetical protein J07HN6_00942 [Halonotius sp. J07HN6]
MNRGNMAFRNDSIDEESPTHRLVTTNDSGVKDWDDEGLIGVENQAMDIILDYGSIVHVDVDTAHSQFEAVENKLTRLQKTEQIFVAPDYEYRAVLPDDRSFIHTLLETQNTDEWDDRLFNLNAFAVLADQTWTYRSVPHESHIREINATGDGGLIKELHDTLDQLRGATVEQFNTF